MFPPLALDEFTLLSEVGFHTLSSKVATQPVGVAVAARGFFLFVVRAGIRAFVGGCVRDADFLNFP